MVKIFFHMQGTSPQDDCSYLNKFEVCNVHANLLLLTTLFKTALLQIALHVPYLASSNTHYEFHCNNYSIIDFFM